MTKLRVQDTVVMASGCANGVRTLDGIKYAIQEQDGGISIIKQKAG